MRHLILWLSWMTIGLAGALPVDSQAQQDRNWSGWGPVQQPNDRHWGGWGNDQPIICESQKYRYRECRTGTYDRVMLYRQYSDSRCVEGQSWGQRNGMVWVDRGCRGAFKRYRWNNWPNSDYSIVCASNSGQRNHCGWNSRYGTPRLIYQLSSAPCVQGRSWGYSNGRIWVDNYCRGRFGTQSGWGGSGGSGGSQSFRCESVQGHYNECRVPTMGQAYLLRNLSDTRCTENRNWGQRGSTLWVNGGCRGEFAVRNGSGNGGWGGSGGSGGNNYTVTCASENGRYRNCAWDHNRGRPWLVQRLSNSPCVEGRDWGYDRYRGLWVNNGCRARFGVR